uniref:Protein kinase domain-containing protein n=1 Tax=Parascaris univalens TaxID=6257 RepID=A0A915A1K7_PARUN
MEALRRASELSQETTYLNPAHEELWVIIEVKIKTSILLRGIKKQSWELDNDSVKVETVIGHVPHAVISEGRILIDGIWRTVMIEISPSTKQMDVTREQIRAAANEARILNKFEHTNIIKTYGIALLREPVLFVSEAMANAPTLYSTLRRRRGNISDVEKVESMCLACAIAVQYIHSKKCIHRCIGARNVLYTGDKLAKLCEFGLARTGDVYVLKKSQRVPLRWMAPESLAACTFTAKSDVFSFGIFLLRRVAESVLVLLAEELAHVDVRYHYELNEKTRFGHTLVVLAEANTGPSKEIIACVGRLRKKASASKS